MDELNAVNLLNVLKSIIENFPSPLFTQTLGKKYASLLNERNIENISMQLIKSLPEDNFNTSRLIFSTLNQFCFETRNLAEIFSKFFSKSFFRYNLKTQNLKNKIESILFHLIFHFQSITLLHKNRDWEKENKNKIFFTDKKKFFVTMQRSSNLSHYFSPSIDIFVKNQSNDSHFWNLNLQFIFPYLSFVDMLVKIFFFLISFFFLIYIFFLEM
jgi:hypothetical protein